MSRSGFVAGALLLTAVLLWVVVAWPTARPELSPHASAAEPPALPPPSAAASAEPAQPTDPRPNAQAEAPRAANEPAAPATPDAEFPSKQGPIEALRQQFERDVRDSSASEPEGTVRNAFGQPDIAPELFGNVQCRNRYCKLELRMTPERRDSYRKVLTGLLNTTFTPAIGVAPATQPSAGGERAIVLYLQRRAPGGG